MSGLAWSLLAAGGGALLYGVGSVLQARAAGVSAAVSDLVRSPAYLGGLLCDLLAWLLSLVALRHLPLFAVQSILAGSLAVTAVLGIVVLRHSLARAGRAAVVLLVLALVALAFCSGDETTDPVSRAGRLALVVGAGVTAVVVVASVATGRGGPTLQAFLSGLAFSGAAVGARAIGEHGLLTDPVTYAVVVYGVLGALAYATALEHGDVTGPTATLWAVEVVVPTVAGLAGLGDTVRHGMWPVLVIAIVVVVGATLVLARDAPG